MDFFYRNDVKMTSGKVLAQLCHAAMLPLLSIAKKNDEGFYIKNSYAKEYMAELLNKNINIIPLESNEFFKKRECNKDNCHLIFDTGKTVFNGVFTATAMLLISEQKLSVKVVDYENAKYNETKTRQVFVINYGEKRDFFIVAKDAIRACVSDIINSGEVISENLFFDANSCFHSWFLGGFPKIALISKNIAEQKEAMIKLGVTGLSINNDLMNDSILVLSPQDRFLVDQITSGLRLY